MGCCGSSHSGRGAGRSGVASRSNAAAGDQPGTAISAMVSKGLVSAAKDSALARSATALGGGATGKGGTAAQNRSRARLREKAICALVDTFKERKVLVPDLKWRRQYMKVAGLGPLVADAIAEHLRGGAHGIETLDLRAMKIGDEGAKALAAALLTDATIENAILSGNHITNDGAMAFAAAVSAATTSPSRLKLLVLSDNPIGSAGIVALARCLDRLPSLERLELGRGQVPEELEAEGDGISAEAVQAILHLLEASATLKTLVVRGTGSAARVELTPADFTTFVTAAVGHSRLGALFLLECFTTKPYFVPLTMFSDNGKRTVAYPHTPVAAGGPGDAEPYLKSIAALATALRQPSSQLHTLALRFPLSDAAVGLLCGGLSYATALQNLSLRGCDMSATGLRLLGDGLRNNRTIIVLDVSYQSLLIAHPAVLAELRSSSKRRYSLMTNSDLRDSQGSSGADSTPSREEREHPLLPIIQVLHTNRTIKQLIMLGVNIGTDDIEELCSCVEESNNHVLTEVAYTSIGVDALNMKLENFLSINRQRGATPQPSTASRPSFGRRESANTLLNDTVTDRSLPPEMPNASLAPERSGSGPAVVCHASPAVPLASGVLPTLAPHYVPASSASSPTKEEEEYTGPGSSLPSLPGTRYGVGVYMRQPSRPQHPRSTIAPSAYGPSQRLSPHDVELRVGEEESSEADRMPNLSHTVRPVFYDRGA